MECPVAKSHTRKAFLSSPPIAASVSSLIKWRDVTCDSGSGVGGEGLGVRL
jgi:hypothetical protein